MNYLGPILGGIYLVVAVVLAAGLRRQRSRHGIVPADLPPVSVVVAARNEERDLPRCLEALDQLTYPVGRLQIILVNDGSEDATRRIMDAYAARCTHVLATDVALEFAHLPAKSKGLATGCALATGEWIFVTDADAAVPRNWIQAMLANASDDAGVLGGPFVPEGLDCVSQLDEVVGCYLFGVVFAIPGLGGEAIPMGPNMAIRKAVYEHAGGLLRVSPTIAEDMAFLKMSKSQRRTCRGTAQPETVVRVTSVGSIPAMLEQQQRWAVGGLHDAPALIKLAVVLVGIYAWLGSVATLFGWLWSVDAWILTLALRATAESLIAHGLAKSIGLRLSLRQYIALQLYFNIGWLIVPAWAFATRRAIWRGAGYAERL